MTLILLVMAVICIFFLVHKIWKLRDRIEQLEQAIREADNYWKPPFSRARHREIPLADNKGVMMR